MSGNKERSVIQTTPPWIEDGKVVRCSKCGSRNLWLSSDKTAAFCEEARCGFISCVDEEQQLWFEERLK